jgi:DNA polymerase-1
MEVGVFAEYCRDPVMLGALAAGADFHSMLSIKAFAVARSLVENTLVSMMESGAVTRETGYDAIQRLDTDLSVDFVLLESIKEYMEKNLPKLYKRYKKYRQAAKTGMFSILYGSGAKTLAEQMTELSGVYISIQVAAEFKVAFFDLYKGAKAFVEECNEKVSMRHALATIHQHNRTYGWARNLYGRLYLVEPRDAYKLPNWLVQGTCADLMKRKMIEIHKLLVDGGYKSRILLSIHDEIVFELHVDEERTLVPIIKEIMETIPEFEAVKLKAEASFCPTHWASKVTFHSWNQMEEVLKKCAA